MMIMLAGGGTGGHLYPGIAIAEEFRRQEPKVKVMFVITRRSIDRQIVAKEGWSHEDLAIESFRGFSWQSARGFASLLWSMGQAMHLVKSYQPSLIIGLGAYPSVPTMIAGRICGIPLVIQEQNVFPGGANKILARWADLIFTSFAETESFFSKEAGRKCLLAGNPVRLGFSNNSAHGPSQGDFKSECGLEEGKFTVLIFGGSKGAHSINEAVMEGLTNLPADVAKRFQIIHQTGQEDFPRVRDHYQQMSIRAVVLPFIYKMMEAYGAADLVVCRAGATTLAEITALGKPSILIPYPYAVHDHQMVNARAMQQAGAALVIANQELTGNKLWGIIQDLMDNPQKLNKMRNEAGKQGKPEAARTIVREALAMIKS